MLSANHALSDTGKLYRPLDTGTIELSATQTGNRELSGTFPTYLRGADRAGWLPDGFSGGMSEYDPSDHARLVGWCVDEDCFSGVPVVYSDTSKNTTVVWLVETPSNGVENVTNTAAGLRLGGCSQIEGSESYYAECVTFKLSELSLQENLRPLPTIYASTEWREGYLFLNNKDTRGFYDSTEDLPFYDPPAYDRIRNEYGDSNEQRAEMWSAWYDQTNDNTGVLKNGRAQYLYTDGESPTLFDSANAFETPLFGGHGRGELNNADDSVTAEGQYSTTNFHYNFANVGDLFLPSRELCNPTEWTADAPQWDDNVELRDVVKNPASVPFPIADAATTVVSNNRSKFVFEQNLSDAIVGWHTLNNSHSGYALYTTPEWKRKTGLTSEGPDGLNMFSRSKTMFYEEGAEHGYLSRRHRLFTTKIERELEGVTMRAKFAASLDAQVRPSCDGNPCSDYAGPTEANFPHEEMVTCWEPDLPTLMPLADCINNASHVACFGDDQAYGCLAHNPGPPPAFTEAYYSAGALAFKQAEAFLESHHVEEARFSYNSSQDTKNITAIWNASAAEFCWFDAMNTVGLSAINQEYASLPIENYTNFYSGYYEQSDYYHDVISQTWFVVISSENQTTKPTEEIRVQCGLADGTFTADGAWSGTLTSSHTFADYRNNKSQIFWRAVESMRNYNYSLGDDCSRNDPAWTFEAGCYVFASAAQETLAQSLTSPPPVHEFPNFLFSRIKNVTIYNEARDTDFARYLTRMLFPFFYDDFPGRFRHSFFQSVPASTHSDLLEAVHAAETAELFEWLKNTYLPEMQTQFMNEAADFVRKHTYREVTKKGFKRLVRDELGTNDYKVFPVGAMALFSDGSGEINAVDVVDVPVVDGDPPFYLNVSDVRGFTAAQGKSGRTFPLFEDNAISVFDAATFPGELLATYSEYSESRACARFHDGPLATTVLCPDAYPAGQRRPVRIEIALPPSTARTVADSVETRGTVCGGGRVLPRDDNTVGKYSQAYFREVPTTISASRFCGRGAAPAVGGAYGPSCFPTQVCRPHTTADEFLYTPGVFHWTGAVNHAENSTTLSDANAGGVSNETCALKCGNYGRGDGARLNATHCACGTANDESEDRVRAISGDDNVVVPSTEPTIFEGHGASFVSGHSFGALVVPIFGALESEHNITIAPVIELGIGEHTYVVEYVSSTYWLDGMFGLTKIVVRADSIVGIPVGSPDETTLIDFGDMVHPPFTLLDGPLAPPVIVGETEIYVRVITEAEYYDAAVRSSTPLSAVAGNEPPMPLSGAIADTRFNATESGVQFDSGDSPERVLFPPNLQMSGSTAGQGYFGAAMFRPDAVRDVSENCGVRACDFGSVVLCPDDAEQYRALVGLCPEVRRSTGFTQHAPGIVVRPRARWDFYGSFYSKTRTTTLDECIKLALAEESVYVAYGALGSGSCQRSLLAQPLPRFWAPLTGTSYAIHLGVPETSLYDFVGFGFRKIVGPIPFHAVGFARSASSVLVAAVAPECSENENLVLGYDLNNDGYSAGGHEPRRWGCAKIKTYAGTSLLFVNGTRLFGTGGSSASLTGFGVLPLTRYLRSYDTPRCSHALTTDAVLSDGPRFEEHADSGHGLCTASAGPFAFHGVSFYGSEMIYYSDCVAQTALSVTSGGENDRFLAYPCTGSDAPLIETGCGEIFTKAFGEVAETGCVPGSTVPPPAITRADVNVSVGDTHVVVRIGSQHCVSVGNTHVGLEHTERAGLKLLRFGITANASDCAAFATYAGCTGHSVDISARALGVSVSACWAANVTSGAGMRKPLVGGTLETATFETSESCSTHKNAAESGYGDLVYSDVCLRVGSTPSEQFVTVLQPDGTWEADINGYRLASDTWPSEVVVLDRCATDKSYDVMVPLGDDREVERAVCGGCKACDLPCVPPPAFEPNLTYRDGAAVIVALVFAIGVNFNDDPDSYSGLVF